MNLSKSKIVASLQCAKRVWLQVHKKEEARYSDFANQVIGFGNDVGERARRMYADGLMVGDYKDIPGSLRKTAGFLQQRPYPTLFEATFLADGVLVLSDIVMAGTTGLNLIEVKSSTSLKSHFINDAAIQTWVITRSGYPVDCVFIRRINNQFVYQGDGDYRGLFIDEDITPNVGVVINDVPDWIQACRSTLDGAEPAIGAGKQCSEPVSCEFYDYCSRDLPPGPEYPITVLPNLRKLADQLRQAGYEDVTLVPNDLLTKPIHLRVREASITGEPFLDRAAGNFLKTLPYPRYYLDFEGINFPVPIWKGARPYQQIPFQFSCHREETDGGLTHSHYLHTDGSHPAAPFLDKLIDALGSSGPIFVYNQAYEKSVLSALALMEPRYKPAIDAMLGRIVDLLPIMREHYYHPAMKGSWSLKALLPCVAPELDYANLVEIADGGAAQRAFIKLIANETPQERKKELEERMLKYCERDTYAMVRLARFL